MNKIRLKRGQEVWTKVIVVEPIIDVDGEIQLSGGEDANFWSKPEEIMIVKQEIPQFVADYIKYAKTTSCSLKGTISFIGLYTTNYANWSRDKVKLISWMSDEENQEIFAKAWLFGYEVEQEKLYTVEIPNPNNTSPKYKLMLVKGINGVEILRDYYNEKRDQYIFQLTESEIRKDFEWAWKWAKPVEVVINR